MVWRFEHKRGGGQDRKAHVFIAGLNIGMNIGTVMGLARNQLGDQLSDQGFILVADNMVDVVNL